MYTFQDARREKQAMDAKQSAKSEAKQKKIADNLKFARDHDLGILMRRGVFVFYVNFPEYRDSLNPRDLI